MSSEKDEYYRLCDLCVKIRGLIFDDANGMMQGAMVGSPEEVLGFAKEWIQREKGLDYDKRWFKDGR